MDDQKLNRLRTYAWGYFSYHADQRMKAFHFYLLLVTATLAGLFTLLSKADADARRSISCIGLLITVISILFAFLDRRNRELIRNGEAALKHLDEIENLRSGDKTTPHVLEIVAADDYVTGRKPENPILERHIGYSHILRILFWLFGLIGFFIFFILFVFY